MHSLLKWIVYHPWQVNGLLVLLSLFYDFPAVLLVQIAMAKLQRSIRHSTKTWTQALRLDGLVRNFYLSVTVAIVAACYLNSYLFDDSSQTDPIKPAKEWHKMLRFLAFALFRWWKFVLPLPLTLRGHLSRILGLPMAVFAIGVYDTCSTWFFLLPSLQANQEHVELAIASHEIAHMRMKPTSILMINRLFRGGRANHLMVTQELLMTRTPISDDDGLWQTWYELQRLCDFSSCWWWRYFRVTLDIQIAFIVCGAYALGTFCNEPRHEGDELLDATRNNDLERVNALLNAQVDPNVCGSDGSTALHICAQQAIPSIAKALLSAKADPNVSDCLGFTPLHWAVQLRREEPSSSNRLEMVRLLLQHGADYEKPSGPTGTTPLSLAAKKENESSLEVLKEVVGEDQLNMEEVRRH